MAEGQDPKTGRFLPGNKLWQARSSFGHKPLFTSSEDLWAACVEYFEWVEANPLYEDKLVTFQGVSTHEPVAKMRAMTLKGLCLFLDIDQTSWENWRKREDLIEAVTRADLVIYNQKFAGAAAELLSPTIIARDLGLTDRSEVTGKDGKDLVPEASDRDVARAIMSILSTAQLADEGDESKD